MDLEVGVVTGRAHSGYEDARSRLSQELIRHLELDEVRADNEQALSDLGREVHSCLPRDLRAALTDARTVLVSVDPLGPPGGLAAELIHDGEAFLGLRSVVARCQSLSDMLRVVEAPGQPGSPPRHRGLVLAADRTPSRPELPLAKVEAETVGGLLRDAGWQTPRQYGDQPELDVKTLHANQLLEAAELSDVVHLAGHGESIAGQQAFVLPPSGELLTADAIQRGTQHLTALCYVNACSLGASQAVGGGTDHGLAAALRRAGSPAVIANLGPIFDQTGTELAHEFYAAALATPVGEALLTARRVMADRGRNTAPWAAALLLGDPSHRLTAAREPDVEVAAVLPVGPQYDVPPAPGRQASTRLRAAVAWGRAAHDAIVAEQLEPLARLAAYLDHHRAVALILLALVTVEPDPDEHLLDRALDALHPIRHDPAWDPIWMSLLAQRNRLRPGVEPREMTVGNLRVNDRSDPAVVAVLELQRAVDEQEIRRGKASWIGAETDDEAFSRNCVVLGSRARFPGDADADAAALLAARAAMRRQADGEDRSTSAHVAARVLLPLLWSTQRMTHLEDWRERMQTRVLLRAATELPIPDVDAAGRLERALEEVRPSDSTTSRFARARIRLLAMPGSTADPGTEITAVRKAMYPDGETGAGPDGVDWLVWSVGTTLTRADRLRDDGAEAAAAQLDAVVTKGIEELDAALRLGGADETQTTNGFLELWRWA